MLNLCVNDQHINPIHMELLRANAASRKIMKGLMVLIQQRRIKELRIQFLKIFT